VQHFIASYGYAAVFVLMLAESACIPVPSEVIMLFGGALAAGAVAGAHPALAGIIAAGVAGNVAGSYLAWAAGRHWGQAAVRRWGRRVRLREQDIDRAADWFGKYGPAAVFFGRLLPVVRTFISLPAGFADMPAARFGVYTAAGCVPWTAGLAAAVYALGRNWQAVANGFHGPTYLIAALRRRLPALRPSPGIRLPPPGRGHCRSDSQRRASRRGHPRSGQLARAARSGAASRTSRVPGAAKIVPPARDVSRHVMRAAAASCSIYLPVEVLHACRLKSPSGNLPSLSLPAR
jgi:membrane protein DedA with SNARE-associated domain